MHLEGFHVFFYILSTLFSILDIGTTTESDVHYFSIALDERPEI